MPFDIAAIRSKWSNLMRKCYAGRVMLLPAAAHFALLEEIFCLSLGRLSAVEVKRDWKLLLSLPAPLSAADAVLGLQQAATQCRATTCRPSATSHYRLCIFVKHKLTRHRLQQYMTWSDAAASEFTLSSLRTCTSAWTAQSFSSLTAFRPTL